MASAKGFFPRPLLLKSVVGCQGIGHGGCVVRVSTYASRDVMPKLG